VRTAWGVGKATLCLPGELGAQVLQCNQCFPVGLGLFPASITDSCLLITKKVFETLYHRVEGPLLILMVSKQNGYLEEGKNQHWLGTYCRPGCGLGCDHPCPGSSFPVGSK
jgi:hypothetical protein